MGLGITEKHVCRHQSAAFGLAGRRPFAITGASAHYAPDLPFLLEHLKLELTVDPVGKELWGVTTQRAKVISPGQTFIRLDQVGLKIDEVKVGGKPAEFRAEADSLLIFFAEGAPEPGSVIEYSARYKLKNPKRGIYFTGPDAHSPEKRYQVWTQGQDEDSRYWFPGFDYPNQKATSEIIATVPKGYTAVSNGALLSKKELGDQTVFHYRLGTPHVMYLVTLTVAEFSQWEDRGPRDLPIQYFVAPGREDDGRRAFGNTPKMIEAFEKMIGVPYPYEKYSQVAVQDFIFGGMENTSATTQTDLTLHDERAHLDFSSDALVSHELAHQWFGDLLTCRDWSHGWLNEGFATFLERVWIENKPGEGGGSDEAKYSSYIDLREHLGEDAKSYRRPIVCNTYIEPIDLFDTHLYQKGGLVIHLIRSILGEELFWKSIQAYVSRHRGGSVETIDLIRAIEDTTGRNLRRLFDEWVFSAGYPEFELSYQWHEDKKQAELVIEQKQTGGKPSVFKDGATTPLFHLPVTLELTFEGGEKLSQVIDIGEARERVFLQCASKPLMVRFDPGFNIPKTLKFPRPKEMLLYQLAHDSDCMGRIEAAQELGKLVDSDAIGALGQALKNDPFWAVQAEVAQILGGLRQPEALTGLLGALSVSHPKARRAVVQALGNYKDPRTSAVRQLAEKDPSYFVEADATLSWCRSRVPVGALSDSADLDDVESFALDQLKKSSYRELIRGAALRALGELPGIGRGERPRAFRALVEWAQPGKPLEARTVAISTLGSVARTAVSSERAEIMKALSTLADEENFRIRMALVHALGGSESKEAIGILSHLRQIEIDGRIRRHAQVARDQLMMEGETPESVTALKSQLEKLEEQYSKLRSVVEELKGARK